jgi:hypothetical protein
MNADDKEFRYLAKTQSSQRMKKKSGKKALWEHYLGVLGVLARGN